MVSLLRGILVCCACRFPSLSCLFQPSERNGAEEAQDAFLLEDTLSLGALGSLPDPKRLHRVRVPGKSLQARRLQPAWEPLPAPPQLGLWEDLLISVTAGTEGIRLGRELCSHCTPPLLLSK